MILSLRLILALTLCLLLIAVLVGGCFVRHGFGRRKIVPQNICDFEVVEDFGRAADVVRMHVRGYEVINLLHVVALERINHILAVLLVAGVYQHNLAFGRDDEN